MALIDKTYFQKRITAIPNLKDEVLQDLNDHISLYEHDYLNNVLGVDLKNDFETGISLPTPAEKWTKLRDGAEFEYEDIKYKWSGFNNIIKDSPIAYYIMYWFVRNNNTSFTGIGAVTSNSENSTRIDPRRILVDNWNSMVKHNDILEKFLKANESDYSNYEPLDTLTEIINVYGI